MARPHRHDTLDEDLLPTFTTRNHDFAGQVESMREIRELSNGIAASYRRRDELFQALALSNSLSREDMARAAGLNKSRVDQIIRELTEQDQERKNRAAADMIRRHMPSG